MAPGNQYTLRAYEISVPTNTSLVERVFKMVLVSVLCLFLGAGAYLRTVRLPEEALESRVEAIRTRMVIEEKKRPPAPPRAEKREAEKPVDLTTKPLLKQKEEVAPPKEEERKAPVVKPVYGLRRVYSVGIGAQGGMADAVIGKKGNTLDKEVDTVTPLPVELKGPVAATSTVTSNAKPKNKVLPEVTQEMKDAGVNGVIRVKVLIDIDGTVKQAEVLNDLGYGTAEKAREAALKWSFEPAMRDGVPVAVWVTLVMRFQAIEG